MATSTAMRSMRRRKPCGPRRPTCCAWTKRTSRTHPIVNVLAGIITTNHRTDGLYLPADDRRHFVLWSDATKEDPDFAGDYWKNLWGWYYGEGGIENVAAFLKARDLSRLRSESSRPSRRPPFGRWSITRARRRRPSFRMSLRDWAGRTPSRLSKSSTRRPATYRRLAERAQEPARSIPHKFDRCGYIALRNDGSKDGRWKVGGKNRVIYVRAELSGKEQYEAAARLIEAAR